MPETATPRVAEELSVSEVQVRALLKSGDLRAFQIGGRMWRVSEDDLADYLERAYKETEERIASGTIKAEALDGED